MPSPRAFLGPKVLGETKTKKTLRGSCSAEQELGGPTTRISTIEVVKQEVQVPQQRLVMQARVLSTSRRARERQAQGRGV